MRKEQNRSRLLRIAVIAFMAVIIFPAANVKADRGIGIEKNHFKKAVVLSEYDKKEGEMFWLNSKLGKILKVESSDKSVATVKKWGDYGFYLLQKKLGTTKITITMLKGDKKVKRSGTV